MAAKPEAKKPNLILTPDSRLRVFVSSTLKELAEDREVVRQSILELHLQPVLFEAGARPHPARELYQAYLSQSHVFIGIYWQSYGWVGPDMDISGLEDEYNLSSHLPRLIYIKSPAPDREPRLKSMLQRLQQEDTSSYKHFSSSAELGELVANDLALLLSESYEAASRAPETELVPHPVTNIPFPRNPMLGRDHELETVCRWLSQDDTALVTLTGAGGAGKSRLAIEAGLQLRGQFSDGVYLVRLTHVNDPERVLPTIAETLDLREALQGRPVEDMLKRYLRDRRVLLVLDNFEQVLSGALKVAELLEACPRLKVLATSRAPLRLRSEKELLIQPLEVPNLKELPDPARLSQYAAVELFIQRAQGVRPDFQVTNRNAPAVAEICYRLDGLPLAIELAAARIKLLSPQELLSRLSHGFEILRGGTRDLPERQQTLRGAIDWSYNLLTEPSRAIFRRLSVFVGGFSLEAAEAVCGFDGDATGPVLEQIEALMDFSLLSTIEGVEGRQRFGMLETIREYAAERLSESTEAGRVRRLHAEYLLRFVREIEPRIRTAERARWRTALEQELDNIRSALQWASTNPEGRAIGQSLMIASTYFWALCGAMSEGRRYCDAFLAQCDDETPPEIRAGLMTLAGTIALLQGGTTSVESDWKQVVEIARQSGDKRTLATALLLGGAWALSSGDLELAARYFEECRSRCHALGDEWSEVLATLWLGNTATLRGEHERGRQLAERGLAMARHQGDPWLLVVPLIDVAQDAFANGDWEKAEATLLETESLLRAAGDQWTLGWPLTFLAQIRLSRGNLASAASYLAEALQNGRTYGNTMTQVYVLIETACLITLRCAGPGTDPGHQASDCANAARLCGATQSLASLPLVLGSVISSDVYGALLGQARAAVQPDIWEQGFAEGASMPLEQALDLAAAELRQTVR